MAIKRLDLRTLRRVLNRYDLGGAWEIEGRGGGTANLNLVLRTPRGRLFFRRRNPRYASPDQVAYEHALMRHLAARGIGGPLPIETRDGQTAVRDGDDVFELQHFVEGSAFEPQDLGELRGAARGLAAFHAALDDFAPPVPKTLPRYDAPNDIRAGYEPLLAQASVEHSKLIWRVLDVVAKLEARFPDAAYQALPHCIIHGDYHPANVLFRGSEVAGIFDLDWVSRQPRVRDLSDGIYYFAGRRRSGLDGADIYSLTQGLQYDTERARIFLEAYREAPETGERRDDAGHRAGTRHVAQPPSAVRVGREGTQARAPVAGNGRPVPQGSSQPAHNVPDAGHRGPAYNLPREVGEEELRALPLVATARWLFSKVAGMRKVPERKRVAFALRDALLPIDWLDEHGEELVAALHSLSP